MTDANGQPDPRLIPGAMAITKRREVPGVGTITFESAPVGWLTQAGTPRMVDWRAYWLEAVDGKRQRYPSVTTILDSICGAGGLPRWYEARGIEGAVEAIRLGLIDPADPASAAMAVDVVRERKLGADRARDDAATRGINVHDCLEHYMRTGDPPSPQDHPAEHHGYLRAMTRWLLKANPEPTAVEELVCHPEAGYAGRLDLRAHTYGALTTWDAKTQANAGIYLKAHAQVNLYERAAVRCGDEPADRLAIVVFAEDGGFDEMPADHPEAFTDAALAWVEHGRPVDALCMSRNRVAKDARKVAA